MGEYWYILVAIAAGWLFARLDDLILGYREYLASQERIRMFDKAITKGDPIALYNLKIAERVGESKEAVEANVAHEIARKEGAEQVTGPAPWEDHPDYAGCDVFIDMVNGKAMIFNPNAVDGPEIWDEELDVFMAKFE